MDQSQDKATDRMAKPRIRSEAQLARKRSVDRAHHSAKRIRSKNQLDAIEQDTSDIRRSIQRLAEEMHSLKLAFRNPPLPSEHFSHSQPPSTIGTSPFGAPEIESGSEGPGHLTFIGGDDRRLPPSICNGCCLHDVQMYDIPEAPAQLNVGHPPFAQYSGEDVNAMSQAFRDSVVCKCDLPHRSDEECYELATYTFLFKAHRSLSQGVKSLKDLPRNATLENILLLRDDGSNPIAHAMNTVYRSTMNLMTIPTAIATYYLHYRFLRWRAYPDAEAFADLPHWLHPTPIQTSLPHPLCIDYLPWPGLRDHLSRTHGGDSRQTVNLYLQSMVFRWPPSRTFIAKGPGHEAVLSPEFITAICQLENWALTREWALKFPNLVSLVNIQDDLYS